MKKLACFALLGLAGCGGASSSNDLYIMTRFWGSTGSLEIASYLFADDGIVVRDPVTPADALDLDAERQVHPGNVGTYEWDGDTLTMTFDGKAQALEVERDGDCFTRDMGIFCPVEGVDFETLDGTYGGGASISLVGGGSASTAKTVRFKEDGTYTLDSAGSVSATSSASSVSGGSSGTERGTYRFDGTVLSMTPEGGAERKLSTFAYDDGTEGKQPRRLYFGGTLLKRED